MAETLINDYSDTLAVALSAVATTCTVSAGCPAASVGSQGRVRIGNEICTATFTTATGWTLSRAVEDSTRFPAAAWPAGTAVRAVLTAAGLTGVLGAVYQPLDADLTALAALSGTDTIYYRSAASTWTAVTVGANLTFAGGTLSSSGGSPGGSSGQLQYNASGAFAGAAWSTIATVGEYFTVASGVATDTPVVIVAHASQSASLLTARTSGGTSVLTLLGGTTAQTLLVVAVPSGAGGPAGVRLDVDGSARWTFFSSGATSYAFNLSRFGGNEGFSCSTGGIFTVNDTICMPQRTGDPSGVTNSAHIYVKDVAGTAEVFVRDEAGNVTQISPHAADGPADLYAEAPGVETVYRSVSESTGRVEWLNWSRLARAVERLTGEKLRHVETLAEYESRGAP